MRAVILAVMLSACSDEAIAPTPDAAAVTDPLVARMTQCGPSPAEPVLDPATMTDSRDEQFVILFPEHWATDAAYMDAMNAWARCVEFGNR